MTTTFRGVPLAASVVDCVVVGRLENRFSVTFPWVTSHNFATQHRKGALRYDQAPLIRL
jgi:hypothetical protein